MGGVSETFPAAGCEMSADIRNFVGPTGWRRGAAGAVHSSFLYAVFRLIGLSVIMFSIVRATDIRVGKEAMSTLSFQPSHMVP